MSLPFNKILVLDFETRWSRKPQLWCPEEEGYTLSNMTTEAYVRSPHFKAFGVGIHEYNSPAKGQWYMHSELPRIFSTYDWSKTAVVCQNAMFDCSILSFIYDVHPVFIFDTLSMARAIRGVEAGNSLSKLAAYFGLPPKGFATASSDGLFELPPEIERELADYCVGGPGSDVELTEAIFGRLLMGVGYPDGRVRDAYPTKELRLISMTVKMATEPKLVLDAEMLKEAVVDENQKLQNALQRAGVDESTLASNDKFAELLTSYGVTPPMKTSKQTGKPALALAKSDAHFQQLLNGDNEDVALLCEARLRVKSTQARTRAQRFIDIAGRGTMPVPLNYYAAETGRWGGTQNINLQNMKRKGFLRRSIMAPPGYVLCVGDLSQIEPRVLSWLSDYHAMLDIFRAGGDPYATFGAQMFSIPGLTKDTHPLLRQSAKSALLGAGYQLGWSAFAEQLLVGFLGAPPVRYTREDAKQLGVTQAAVEKFLDYAPNIKRMNKIARTCTDNELLIHCLAAKAIIDKYRAAAEPVVDFWNLLGKLIQTALIDGKEYDHKGVLLFRKEEVVLPSGMSLKYPNLRQEMVRDEDDKMEMQYIYDVGTKVQKLYPGRLCNNVTQGVARVLMTDGMLRVEKKYPVLFTVHDESAILCPAEEAEFGVSFMRAQMLAQPKWMPDIPLDCEVSYAERYGEAK